MLQVHRGQVICRMKGDTKINAHCLLTAVISINKCHHTIAPSLSDAILHATTLMCYLSLLFAIPLGTYWNCVQGVLCYRNFWMQKKILGPDCDLNPSHIQSRHALREPHHLGSWDSLKSLSTFNLTQHLQLLAILFAIPLGTCWKVKACVQGQTCDKLQTGEKIHDAPRQPRTCMSHFDKVDKWINNWKPARDSGGYGTALTRGQPSSK